MARYTMKDPNGRYYIESKNGKLESDIKGHTYGEAIDRFAEYENADVVPRSDAIRLERELNDARAWSGHIASKEKAAIEETVARAIFKEIKEYLVMFSHIHKYAEEARQSNEKYADGTPCEMTSVWDVLSLHKNGWDDYETMCKLQDNIGNIEKSRLLKEIEGDFAKLEKKYIGE